MTEHRALCGWLMKQDAKSLWKGWKKRWFQQLHDYHLYYFPTCTTDTTLSKGFIDMKAILHVQVDPSLKDKNIFNIVTQDRTYILQANSSDEVEYWISGINAIVASLSQPLTALISKAELFELQQQHKNEHEQRQRATTQSPSKPKSNNDNNNNNNNQNHRAMSMRYPPLVHNASTGEMKVISRSSSLQNITYIDYDASSPPPPSSSPSLSSCSVSGAATISSFPSLQPSTPPSHPSVSSLSSGSKSTPVSPVKQSNGSFSMPFLDIISNPGAKEQDVEKEKIEKKKWASMKDIQALIVREKDAEIARLTIEVARLNEMHEKAIESTKVLRQELHMQFEHQRMEDAQKMAETEKNYKLQIEELTINYKKKAMEADAAVRELDEARNEREETIVEFEKLKIDTNNKIVILESEIKLKENVISQLNTKITSMNGELSAKDSLLEDAVRGITYPQVFDDTLTVAQLEKEREMRHALQEQCAFLGQEIFKLETELKQHRILIAEQKNKILERSSSGGGNNNLASSPKSRHSSVANFANVAPSPMDLDTTQVNILTVENEALRQKYFMSLGRSLKLQTTMNGGFSNVSIADIYDQALQLKLKIEQWPNFISDRLADSLKDPPLEEIT